jgi:hypothetical protein
MSIYTLAFGADEPHPAEFFRILAAVDVPQWMSSLT